MRYSAFHLPSRSALLRGFGTLAALGLLGYLLKKQGWQEIASDIQQIGWARLSLALILMFGSRLAVSTRWYYLLRSGGIKISMSKAFQLNFAGLFSNNFLPATIGGDVVRLAGGIQLGLDGAMITASLVADRVVGMAGMATSLLFGLPRFLASPVAKDSFFDPSAYILAGFLPLPLRKRWKAIWETGLQILYRILGALTTWIKQPRSLLAPLVYTATHMICLFLFLSLIFSGMGSPQPYWVIAGLYSLVYFITLLPISINGYGVQELSMALVFHRFAGASMATGLAAALLFRTLMMISSLPGALFVPDILAWTKGRPQGENIQ